MDRTELADFLRRSRERLRPHDVGLPDVGLRRTPGLRREELAQLAGVSADYCMRLEQRRSSQPSTQVLAALARALRLTEDERDHLYILAGYQPPAGPMAGQHVRPGLMHLLDELTGTPAQILTDLGDLLAQNVLAELVFGAVCTIRGSRRNVVWRWFTEPAVRAAHPENEHEEQSRVHVADLRAAVARRGLADPAATALVRELRATSPEFADLWELHEVAVRRRSRMRVQHPGVGILEFDSEILLTPAEDQHLLIFTPPPGGDTAEKLALLRVMGHQGLSSVTQ
jgi:transcriptional regulator with XRE-family HTH domain